MEDLLTPELHEETTIIVNKSNALITGQGRLTTNQVKLFLLCIGLVNPLKPERDSEGYIFVELDHQQIAEKMNTETRYVKRFIADACIAFHSIPIRLKPKLDWAEQTVEPTSIINIAHRSFPLTEYGTFKIQFHKQMETHIIDLAKKGYTALDYKHVVEMDSKHSIKIYELLSKAYNKAKGGTQITRISLKDMWYSMGLTDAFGRALDQKASYTSSYSEFNRRVLKAAVLEINGGKKSRRQPRKKNAKPKFQAGTDLKVSYKPYRGRGETGRKVAGITFCITPSHNTDDPTKESPNTIQSLVNIGINVDIAQKLADTNETDVIERNVSFFENVQEGGLAVKSVVGLMRYFIENDIAGLPSVANPYSEDYKGNTSAIKFVQKCVMPIWRKLPDNLQAEIIESGLMGHPKTAPDLKGFITYAKESDLETAELFYSGDDILDRWT